jgi:hypothetical protein
MAVVKVPVESAPSLGVSARDRRILALALGKLRGRIDFGDAIRALREAVEEAIPDGRVFALGRAGDAPIMGSLVSGVGLVETAEGVQIVRALPDSRWTLLARFAR